MVRMPRPGENPKFDQEVQEARDVRVFLDSPIFAWLKSHLTKSERRLIHRIAGPTQSEAERLMLIGKLALVTELLERPEEIVKKLEHLERTSTIPPDEGLTRGASGSPVGLGVL